MVCRQQTASTMFAELANLLQLDVTQSQVVAVTEQSPAEASFLLCHLINSALRVGAAVRVLALDKPASHYRHLCAKCGTNVRQAESDATLTFVDGADMALRALRSGAGRSALDEGALPVQALFERLTASAGPAAPERPGLVVVDGLSALLALGCSPAEVLLLVHNLDVWSRRRGALLATLLSRDAEDEPLRRLAAAVAVRADLAVTVAGLSSGHCAEVTGELQVRRAGGAAAIRQFKAEDRNVRVFAAGTSRAVL